HLLQPVPRIEPSGEEDVPLPRVQPGQRPGTRCKEFGVDTVRNHIEAESGEVRSNGGHDSGGDGNSRVEPLEQPAQEPPGPPQWPVTLGYDTVERADGHARRRPCDGRHRQHEAEGVVDVQYVQCTPGEVPAYVRTEARAHRQKRL